MEDMKYEIHNIVFLTKQVTMTPNDKKHNPQKLGIYNTVVSVKYLQQSGTVRHDVKWSFARE